MKRIKLLFLAIGIIGLIFMPSFVMAEEIKDVKAAVTVAAVVPTRACPQYSSFVANNTQILADATQKITFTVIVKDCIQVPLANSQVTITSNRGAIDKIDYVDENGNVLDTGDGLGSSGITDANGYVFFEGYSGVPGEAVFSAKVDTFLDLNQVKITFLPLPFPKNITVALEVPKFISSTGIITIFRPKDYDVDKDKLVNMTMELRIPIWVFYLIIFVILLNTTMFSTIMALIFKIRKLQKVEIEHIEQEEQILNKEEQEIEKIAEEQR